MKKITLLFFMSLLSLCTFAQVGIDPPEGFEDTTFPPTGWTIHNNGIGMLQQWKQTIIAANGTYPPHTGDYAAFIDRENVPDTGDPAKDWIVTPSFEMPVSGQLRFWSRLTLPGNQGTIYRIMIAPAGADLDDLASYTTVQTYTEALINPEQTEYNEIVLSLPGTAGQNYHVAFIMEGDFQDRWLIDDVAIVQQCLPPTNLGVSGVTDTTATLTWTGASPQYEVEVVQLTEAPTGSGVIVDTNSYVADPLLAMTPYRFYVRSICGTGNSSDWAGPFNFSTAPENDACADAIALTVNPTNICTSSTPGSINGATASAEANTCGGTDDDDVWFTFVATATTHLINLNNITNGTTDLFHVVYSGTDCGALTQLYCSDPNNSTANGLTVGQTYYVRVYSWTATAGQTSNFNICVGTPPPPPANDECANATAVAVNPDLNCAQFATGTIYSATASADANSCGGTDDDDVWFSFVATSANHTINLNNITGGTTDLYHAVYSGTCGSLTNLVCSDPNNSIVGGLTIGNTYYVRVYSWTATANQTSVFDICIGTPPPPPANDDCVNATAVAVNPDLNCTQFTQGTIAWATPSADANSCFGTDDDDVWFSFVATATTHTINLNNITGGTTDLFHAVYSGSCGTLTNLVCSDPNNSLVGGLTIGNTYYVRVYSWTSTPGQTSVFDICVGTPPPPPANDECANATVVLTNPDLLCGNVGTGTIAWATGSVEANSCFGTDDDDVWFQFVATSTTHTVDLTNITGGTTDLYHAVYSGTCGALTNLVCSDPNNSIVGGLTIGNTYYVRVYSWTSTSGQTSTFNICIGTPPPPPANDECADAIQVLTNTDLSCTNFESGTIAWATGSLEPNSCFGTDDDDVWFSFVATNEVHTINLNNVVGSTTFLYHVLYEGVSCGSMTQVYCSTVNSSLATGLTVGQTYYVRVYSSTATGGQTTTFDICVGTPPPPPANDECANAVPVPVNPTQVCAQTVPGSIAWTTPSAEGNTCFGTDDDDVWFEFVATGPTHLISLINITGGTTDLYHVLYEGDECGTLTQLYCSDPNQSVANGLTAGNTYKIRVYSWTSTSNQQSSFDVCVGTPPPPPANDECAEAIPVPVNPAQFCIETVPGTIYSATASAEGNTCGGTDDDDVWFEFVATGPEHIISLLNITDGTTDLYHVLYEGDECGALTQLYCSDPNQSLATGLTAGTTYKIRVYSWTSTANQTSSFDVCVGTPPPPPANDECADATVVPVNTGSECIESVSASIYSATASPEGNTCGGTDDDDVWFEFTATNTTHFITLYNINGGTTDLYHVLYEGDECGALTQVYCSDNNQSLATGLTVGTTYKVRVYSWTGTPGQTSNFDICVGTPAGSILVDDTTFTTEQLVETVLIGSECAIVSNIASQSGSDFGGSSSIGYFNFNDSSFPFNDGVILATGSINEAPGPNPNNNAGAVGTGWGGDADLSAIIAEGGNTGTLNNATILEFDFVPLTNQITFDFLFASQEYGTFQCNFSDAFAFILTDLEDEDAVPVNLAVIPGTNVPVSVVNIRDAAYNAGCPSVNPEYFGSYNPNNPYGSAIGYNGQTVVMTAAGDVIPGNQYHIKLVIADYNDSIFNSAVFLAGGSFDIGGIDIGADLTIEGGTAICDQEESTISTGLDEDLYDFVWYTVDGDGIATEIPGETGADLVVNETNDYRVIATYTGSTCSLEGNKRVEFYLPVPETVGAPVDLIACDASGFSTFDFTSNTDLIEAGVIPGYDVADFVISYHASEDDAQNNVNPIGPVYENTVAGSQAIYVRVVYTPTGCVGILNFNLIIQDLTPDFDMGGDFNICEGTTGVTIDLVANNYDPASPDVTYSWTYNGDALPDTGSSVAVTGEGTYEVTVSNSGCEATQSVFVTVTPVPVADVMTDVTSCDSYVLPALSAGNNYYTGPAGSGDMLTAGTELTSNQMIYIYAESGTTPVNCTDESSFMVSVVPTPVLGITGGCEGGIYTLEVSLDDNYTENTVLIEWTGPNGSTVGTGLTAVADATGDYMVTVTPLGGDICSSVLVQTVESIACTIPRGISPNGDGMNDEFDLTGFNVTKIGIFNRYGKEVYSQGSYNKEWHGQDKGGNELPTGTYFYSIELGNGDSKTGWVYINRED
ncbi:choice-of-anchor L domain-containing protein [Flavobacterium alkalisoli]|uniref:choice-of-anchor L domain-containing protein n=1 Tax=Flavobacterium alkalisoli TaxID=2602769 RepID=UPI003A936BA8